MIDINEILYCCEARYDSDFVETGRILKEYEIIFIRKGSVIATLNGNVFPVYENQLVIVASGCFFSLRNNNCEAEVVIGAFSFRKPPENFDDAVVIELEEMQARYFDRLIVLSGKNDETSRQLLRLMTELQFVRLLGGEFMTSLDECGYGSAKTYSRIYRYLKENAGKRLSLTKIAADNEMSVSSLKSIVMRYTGSGVVRLLNIIRIHIVTKAVKSGEDVKTAVKKAGINDIRYFRRLLRKETGFNSVELYFGE